MKKVILNGILATFFLTPFAFAEDAEAREYCREYQKTIRVGGSTQSGYGTACQQQDGSWMIVDSRGNVDPFEDLYQSNAVIVAQDRPVYFDYGPRLRPVTYYVPRRQHYYRPQPGLYIGFNNGFHDRDWNRNRHWHGNHHGRNHRDWDRHDRDNDRNNGRNHRKH